MSNIPLAKIGWLLIAWAFFIGLVGLSMGPAVLLMVLGSILYLFP